VAIVQTGTTLDFPISSTNYFGTVSTTITVPSDAQFVVVGLSNYGGGTNNKHSGMTFTKGGVNTAMTPVFGADATTNWNAVAFYLAAPDTGTNKTLAWLWDNGTSSGDLAFSVTFWKGVDTTSPVRDTDGAQGSGWPRNTPTLTCVSGDKIIAFAGFYYGAGGGAGGVTTWNNLTELAEITNQGPAEGTWATGDPTGDTTVGVQSCTGSEGGIVAIVVKPAAGGTAYTLTAAAGTLTLAGQIAALRNARKIAAVNGTLALSGQTVTLRYARKMPAGLGVVTMLEPVVNLIYSGTGNKLLPAGLGFPRIDGKPATLRYARVTIAGRGTLTVSGRTANLAYVPFTGDHVMPASAGVLALAGQSAELRISRTVQPTAQPGRIVFGRTVWLRKW